MFDLRQDVETKAARASQYLQAEKIQWHIED
jgi:hypothetical protein